MQWKQLDRKSQKKDAVEGTEVQNDDQVQTDKTITKTGKAPEQPKTCTTSNILHIRAKVDPTTGFDQFFSSKIVMETSTS